MSDLNIVKVDPLALSKTADRKYRLWMEFNADKKFLQAQACIHCGLTGGLALSAVQNIVGWIQLYCTEKKCGQYVKVMRDRYDKLLFQPAPIPAPPKG